MIVAPNEQHSATFRRQHWPGYHSEYPQEEVAFCQLVSWFVNVLDHVEQKQSPLCPKISVLLLRIRVHALAFGVRHD